MNQNEIVSVIVPVYNVEKYLDKCVQSIIHQTYKNLEIILVNDGSTDRSGEICNNYYSLDNRIQVIHKLNGGLSDARNAGIDICSGNYITFVDSDDWLERDAVEALMNLELFYQGDIVASNFDYDLVSKHPHNKRSKPIIMDSEKAMYEMVKGKLFQSHAWAKLYKKELFNEVRYPKGKIYEDMFTTYKLIDKASKVIWTNKVNYHYVVRENSISREKFSVKQLDYVEASLQILEFCKEKYPKCVRIAKVNYQRCVLYTIDKYLRSSSNDFIMYQLLCDLLKRNNPIYNLLNDVEMKVFIKKKLFQLFPRTYKKLKEKI